MKSFNDMPENKAISDKPSVSSGTLYSLASNIDDHNIFLYTNKSEHPSDVANRFLLMHRYPFAAGGYAGRFARASSEFQFVNHEEDAAFKYTLNQEGLLSALRYDASQNSWTLFFEGYWYSFVNKYGASSDLLYAVPGFRTSHPRIMTISEGGYKIKNLYRLLFSKQFSERFKKISGFCGLA